MDTSSSPLRDLARRLLASSQTVSGPHVAEAVLASEKLRISVTRFAGADGYTSLLRRALALARAELPSLQDVTVSGDGRLEGLEQVAADTGTGVAESEPSVGITTYLLGLLVTFIGRPFTMRLLREAWPDTPLDELHSTIEAD